MINFLYRTIFCLFFTSSILIADLVKPFDGQYVTYRHILFEWDQEPDAIMYNIQLSESNSFTEFLLDINTSKLIYIYKDDINWNSIYYWRVRPIYDCDGCDYIYGEWSQTSSFNIADSKLVNDYDVEIYNLDLINDGLTLVGLLTAPLNQTIVFDMNGREIWNDGHKEAHISHINEYGQMSGGSFLNFPSQSGIAINYDLETLWEGPTNTYVDLHEVKTIPNGNYMGFDWEFQLGPIPIGGWTPYFQSIGYEADGETAEVPWYGQAIVEWDENSNEIWRWSPFDDNHFTMDDYDAYGGTWWNAFFDGDNNYDWMHSNAFDFDLNESAIYFSSRHLSRITKIDYPSGDIIWMIGMPSQFMSSGDAHICTELGFTWQHNIQFLDNGNLLFFDNGNLSQLFNNNEPPTSRALEFKVIDNSYCEVIWEYELPNELDAENLHGPWMGSAQILDNDNYLINTVGGGGHAIEITPDKQIICDIDYDLNLANDPDANYRSYRIPSIHPNAYSVLFNDYKVGEFGEGIYLDDNTFSLTVFNESGYKQFYSYNFSDTNQWFENLSETIEIEPYSSIDLIFEGNNIDISTSVIEFDIKPVYHDYDHKIYNLSLFYIQNGDLNSDGIVNILDVVILVGVVLGNNEEIIGSDINQDGIINVLDVVLLINMILE